MKKIDVKTLLSARVGTNEKVEIADSLADLEFVAGVVGSGISGRVKVTKLEDCLLVTGGLDGDLKIICDRCLEEFDRKIPIKLESCYYIDRKEHPAEDFLVDKYGQIDLTEAVREEIILNTSLKNICKLDCLGICPECGENKNFGKCQCK